MIDRKRIEEYRKGMSMIPWMVMAAGSAIGGYFNPIPQPGEPGYTAVPTHHFRVQFENDSACDEDMNYTHGTRFDYVKDLDAHHSYGASLTQNIYTPERHSNHANPGEHPYAGYLAVGAAYLYRGENFGSSVEFQIGTSGKASLAKESQNNLHSACGMATWDGWNYQVPSELMLQLSSRQDYRLTCLETSSKSGLETDGLLFTREDIGTMLLSGGAGFSFRVGRNLPNNMQVVGNTPGDFGVGMIQRNSYDPTALSYFLLAQTSVHYVARDFSVDGGVFHHFRYKTCGRTPWQAQAKLGVGVAYQGMDYFAGIVLHSRTYRTQDRNSLYGTFSVNWNW